jgi:hypothetical protein
VVRQEWSLSADGRLAAVVSNAPQRGDRYYADDPRRPLREPSDQVPYRVLVDLLFAGRAHAAAIRMSLLRDGRAIADRTHAVPPGLEGAGMGPLPPQQRLACLRGMHPPQGEPLMTIAHDLDPSWFQMAPVEQRVPDFCAGDQLLLQGLHPTAERLALTVPCEPPMATAALGHASQPVALRCDQLLVDTDAARCVLTWRGSLTVSDPRFVADLVLQARGLEAAIAETVTIAADRSQAPLPAGFRLEGSDSASAAKGRSFARALRRKLQKRDPAPGTAASEPTRAAQTGTAVFQAVAMGEPVPFRADLEGTVPIDATTVAPDATPFPQASAAFGNRDGASVPGAPWSSEPMARIAASQPLDRTLSLIAPAPAVPPPPLARPVHTTEPRIELASGSSIAMVPTSSDPPSVITTTADPRATNKPAIEPQSAAIDDAAAQRRAAIESARLEQERRDQAAAAERQRLEAEARARADARKQVRELQRKDLYGRFNKR